MTRHVSNVIRVRGARANQRGHEDDSPGTRHHRHRKEAIIAFRGYGVLLERPDLDETTLITTPWVISDSMKSYSA